MRFTRRRLDRHYERIVHRSVKALIQYHALASFVEACAKKHLAWLMNYLLRARRST
jgi:hypothetical protein